MFSCESYTTGTNIHVLRDARRLSALPFFFTNKTSQTGRMETWNERESRRHRTAQADRLGQLTRWEMRERLRCGIADDVLFLDMLHRTFAVIIDC